VEDDPTSRAYLAGALQGLPAQVDEAADLRQALELAVPGRHRVWLIDARLPDGTGTALLHRLRRKDPDTPALCHTAEPDPARRAELARDGFDEVIVKPIDARELRERVRRHLHPPASLRTGEQLPRWDDEGAARALNGERAHIDALRRLFLAELPKARRRIDDALAAGRHGDACDELHKLRASCAFVGAGRLAARVQALAGAIESTDALERFRAATEELLGNQSPAGP